ncbi:MAG TPA: 16S rRNA (cytosine(967)-C(5))-methyltransferase RsmB [Gammaproteobacteria bacterium]|nr:16S rRNA (cytosine(967)-C(5))-methyltransferase RsmB [Gammaproteobacteria bacterium]
MRAAAARIVARVVRERVAADDALEASPAFPARDASLLAALVYGALRWHHRLEWQAARLLTRPLKARQDELAALLRIGLLQLQEFRIPEHAAVSATVDAAALLGLRDAGGLVNAVLRRYQRERELLGAQAGGDDEAAFSHPRWLVDLLRRERPDAWQAILEANNAAPPMWLRVNRRRLEREQYLERLGTAGIGAQPSPSVPTAVVLAEPQPVAALPGFAEGDVSVQDVAAQRAVDFLGLEPGQRVLDACAAPGGKAGHILEACDLAEVWAVDRAARLPLVRSNLDRLGLEARLVAGDATRPAEWWDGRRFDRILLDAPCSALGVIRRHPDIKVLRRPKDVAAAVRLQAELLRALWPLLAPGGRLVYATCTLLRQENDGQIAAFLAADHGPEPAPELAGTPSQTLPGEASGDAFYYAWFTKPEGLRSPSVSRTQQ